MRITSTPGSKFTVTEQSVLKLSPNYSTTFYGQGSVIFKHPSNENVCHLAVEDLQYCVQRLIAWLWIISSSWFILALLGYQYDVYLPRGDLGTKCGDLGTKCGDLGTKCDHLLQTMLADSAQTVPPNN